jgi:hypothetical protein
MYFRYLIATIGAAAITIALLIMMNRYATHLAIRDPIHYFGIADFIPNPDARRPRRPPAPEPRPDLPRLDRLTTVEIEVPTERPTAEDSGTEPRIDLQALRERLVPAD